MNVRDLDLNLLRVFTQLLADRKVSAAAESLGVSQPAVSNALKRLRDITRDELFTRTTTHMQPTPFAMQIAEPIAYALATIEATLNSNTSFDPATSDRTFQLGLTDIGEAYVLPKLIAATTASAPAIKFNTVRTGPDTLREAMRKGLIDIALGLLPSLQGNFFHRRMMRNRYVVCARSSHPLAGHARWTVGNFLEQDHVVVAAAGTGHGAVDMQMARSGLDRRVRLTVPHFLAVGPILRESNVVATLPQTLASILHEPYGLVSIEHPVQLPVVSIDVFWHRRQHRDPANVWLRGLMFKLFSGGD